MKYTLTISSDNPADIVAVLSNGAAPAVAAALAEAPNVDLDAAPPVTDSDAHSFPAAPPADTDDGPANDSAPATDARGFPWDERIHASTRALNKDGTWRYKRNTAEDVIKAVEAEIRPGAAGGPVAAPQPAPFVGEQPQQSTAPAPVAPPVALPFPPAAPIPAFLQPTAPAPAPVADATYEQVISKLTECVETQKISQESLPALWAELGVAGVHELQNNPAGLNAAFAKASALLAA